MRLLTGLLALAALALLSERQWRGQVRTVPACGPIQLPASSKGGSVRLFSDGTNEFTLRRVGQRPDTCTIGQMWKAQGQGGNDTLVVEYRCEGPETVRTK